MEQSNIKNIESLLSQVKNITEHYDKIAEERGEKFNVFDIIGLRNDEVKMHSKFLGNLLNPKGSHGMGYAFLNLFVTLINKKFPLNLENEPIFNFNGFKDINPKIVERHVDFVSENRREGGRIDIILEDKSQILIIENKIYAGNQKNQLVRYTNAAKAINKEHYFIIYLTLDGKEMPFKEADEIFGDCFNYNCLEYKRETINLSDNNTSYYLPISYKIEILEWLNECIKETYDKPLLREGIKHYINLIKILTNQTTSKEMNKELKKIIISKSIEATYLIDNEIIIKSAIVESYIKKIANIEHYWHNNEDIGFYDSCVTIKSWIFNKNKIEFFLYFNDNFKKLHIGITVGNKENENNLLKETFRSLEMEGFYFETWTICEKLDSNIYNNINSWNDLLNEEVISNSRNYLETLFSKIEGIIN